ncbi:MAG: glycosyl transferase [Deltaproteobacteria bacterium]|nr:MAG: glycosyl transferase [Deltaproteobacteria bacterium]
MLWFVHADSRLDRDAGAAIRRAAAEGARWGCMSVSIDSRDPRLWLVAGAMNLRARLTGACSGDMGIWATRALYEEVGGFAPLAAFEDLVFADRARRIASCRVLPVPIVTSARRWEQAGTGRTIAWMWALRLAYRVGVPPARLARLYRPDHR